MLLLVAARLAQREHRGICGVNIIGKNAAMRTAAVVRDYVAAFEQLAPVADYVAIDVSSPTLRGCAMCSGLLP